MRGCLKLIVYQFFIGWEGYILYRALVIIFDTGKENKLRLYIFCYSLPFIISFLTMLPWLIKKIMDPTNDPDFPYHRTDICWINTNKTNEDGTVEQSWAYLTGFYLVLIVMLCANIGILSYGLRINLKVMLIHQNEM